jgi:tRNA threonylcarbamoyladenosine biosynthesis protein TsaB
MSWIVGLDTSSAELSIGLVHEGKPFVSYVRYIRHSHAEHITGAVRFLFDSAGIDASQIQHAGVAVGPGSFTGLRIGISFLKGLFFNRDTLLLPVSSLHSMAYSFALFHSSASIVCAMDARQGKVFHARFTKDNNAVRRDLDDRLASAAEFCASCRDEVAVVTDTLGYRKSSVFSVLPDDTLTFPVETTPLQRGMACAMIAARMDKNSPLWKKAVDIVPEYLQSSYAEHS